MQQSRGGMGSHKHGTSGRAPKSPKLRLATKLQAERDIRRARKLIGMKLTIQELFKRK